MSAKRIIIFTAIEMEARAIRRAVPEVNPVVIGIGGKRAGDGDAARGAVIILAGLGGALDPKLKIGEVIVDDPENRVAGLVGFVRGSILTVGQIVSTPAEKAELFRKTGAAAVEMEGAIVRALAGRVGAGFISVRAISDMANEVLNPDVVGFVDDVGKVRPLKLAAGLARRPGLIPYLDRLGKNSKMAAERLGVAVREIVVALQKG